MPPLKNMSVTRHMAHTRKSFNSQDMIPLFSLPASPSSTVPLSDAGDLVGNGVVRSFFSFPKLPIGFLKGPGIKFRPRPTPPPGPLQPVSSDPRCERSEEVLLGCVPFEVGEAKFAAIRCDLTPELWIPE